MNVSFASKDEYLMELQSVCKEVGTEGITVRAGIESMDMNEAVQQISVRSGFHDDRYFYEALIPCGQDLAAGSKVKTEGSQAAEKLIQEIQAYCNELGVTFRGGVWQRPG